MDIVGRTDRGLVRERNEDSVVVDETLGLAVVADGMGGLKHGDVASREAVARIVTHLRAAGRPVAIDTVEAALAAAHDRVSECARTAGGLMGTTCVMFAVGDGRCVIAHAGDSRCYRFHHGELALLTRDHSTIQELVDRGLTTPEAARQSPSRNVITRAIGIDAAFEPECREVVVAPGDLLLLCSDGLWGMLDDAQIARLLSGCGGGRGALVRCVDALVDAGNDAGGQDNITVVLARV